MLTESKARVAQQEQDEKSRFEARQARSAVRTQSAERHRVAVVKQRSAELATKKVVQAEVREKAASLYDKKLQSFVERVSADGVLRALSTTLLPLSVYPPLTPPASCAFTESPKGEECTAPSAASRDGAQGKIPGAPGDGGKAASIRGRAQAHD